MSTKINLTYCGMEGVGETVKLAKQDAARKIEGVLAELATPRIVVVNDFAALVWFEPRAGWVYRIITDHAEGIRAGDLYGNGGGYGDSRVDVIAAATKHLADISWTHDVQDDQAFFATVKGLDPRTVADLVSRAAWQRRYRAAVTTGASDVEAHRLAGQI